MGAWIALIISPNGSLSPNAHVGLTTLRFGAGHLTIASALSKPLAKIVFDDFSVLNGGFNSTNHIAKWKPVPKCSCRSNYAPLWGRTFDDRCAAHSHDGNLQALGKNHLRCDFFVCKKPLRFIRGAFFLRERC